MPRIYPFANALRLRQNISYPIPEVEGDNIFLIAIAPWIELVNKYTNLKLDDYSPEDMIERYIKGELTIDREASIIHYKKDKVEIVSVGGATRYMKAYFNDSHITNESLMAYLVDDIVYDSADSWYVTYDWEPISREVLFNYKDKSHWDRTIASKDKAIVQECTDIFMEFCFKRLHKSELYRILPIDNIDELTPKANDIIDIKGYKKHVFSPKLG